MAMSRRASTFDRRSIVRAAAAVTPGPSDMGGSQFPGRHIDLPVILVQALSAAGTGVDQFLDRLVKGAIWQDDAIRAADGGIVIQAHLAREGLRCVVQIGSQCWYHHPLDTLHLYGAAWPATVMALRDLPLAAIMRHPVLDDSGVQLLKIGQLNHFAPDLGVCIHLDVPVTTVMLPDIND